jgi:site-specific DNA-methyltransferase (adenine-specific)
VTPYFDDGSVRLYVGDCREVVPALQLRADLLVCDPPYGSTSLRWDRWPDGWLETAAQVSSSLWCFGTLRMFMDHAAEFRAAGWSLPSQDLGWLFDDTVDELLWQKHNGSSFIADRFRRTHETVAHFYRGDWTALFKSPQYVMGARKRERRSKLRPAHTGAINQTPYRTSDGGPKMQTSVLRVRGMHGRAIAPTQKPNDVLAPLLRYGCPPGGTVGDLFAGSGSTLIVARALGMKAWGIEKNPEQAEKAGRWLAQLNALDGAVG